MNKYLLLLLLFFAAISSFGQSRDNYYLEAKAYFDKGDYENAERRYKASAVFSKNENTAELTKTRKCITLKSEADAYYTKHDLGNACKKYTELSKLNPQDGLAKRRIKECCPKPESQPPTLSPEPPQPTPLPVTSTPAPEPILSVSSDNISFDADGGEISINVSTNAATWSTKGVVTWCKITKKSENSISLTCEPNKSNSKLYGAFIIYTESKSLQINIVQEIPKNPIVLGDSLFKEKKYDKALIWYTQSAEQGNAEGQSRLGRMYAEGIGVSKNPDKAMEWFKKSAAQGNAAGENGLGYIYQIQENYKEALKWYRKSAQQGLDIAQYNLGVMYEYGCGVKKNEKEAHEWYKKSAAQGCPQALEKLKNKTKK